MKKIEDKFEIVLKDYASVLGTSEKWNKHILITLLQSAQNIYGFLSHSTLEKISKHLNVSLAEVYGVVTFYSQFYLIPQGKYTIKICTGTACYVKGASAILETFQNELEINPGETTKDLKWTLEVVYCLGTCYLAPVAMINNEYYGKLTPDKVKNIIKSY